MRLGRTSRLSTRRWFQFTHPGKGATDVDQLLAAVVVVSIHAPWEGCDFKAGILAGQDAKFQFTHPGKGATPHKTTYNAAGEVSIHAPWEGCDLPVAFGVKAAKQVSIHAPWEGCDTPGFISADLMR